MDPKTPAPSITEQQILELKGSHSEIHLLEHESYQMVVRPPSSGEWERFQAMVADKEKRPKGLRRLLDDCKVWVRGCASLAPSDVQSAYDSMLEERPGLAGTFGAELTRIAGLSDAVTAKKL